MLVRRAVCWISTVAVAVVVALAMPVSQLRTISIVTACCCPDPDRCHCPDHDADPSAPPSMRACHNNERAVAAPELPAFDAAGVAIVMIPVIAVRAIDHDLPAPHPAPPPIWPDAPS